MTTSFRQKEIRIVLMGRTGAGKSATGNTFLGRPYFSSKLSASSVTQQCEKGELQLDGGRRLAIIDTPGFFDTSTPREKLTQEISRCVSMSSPGPHAFLFVVSPNRFTEEEVNTVELFFKMFGQQVERYMIVVFTFADTLKSISIDDFIGTSPKLTNLIRQCSNRKYAIDNETKSMREGQVTDIISLIDDMVGKNGGSYYTNEMYKENEKLLAQQEEEFRLEQERLEREKVKAIEDEVNKKHEGQIAELRQNELALTSNINSMTKQLKIVEENLGERSKEADEYRRQIDVIIRQKDENNERYHQQLLNMQKEKDERHAKEMAEMRQLHQITMDAMRKGMDSLRPRSPKWWEKVLDKTCSIQ